ncbi:hypothetical protein [Gemmobacter aquatilis]|uniref:hypothetical protein n=1 Tax=Gemmobacter aquatilis TaxID=933059 RepID=UPI000B887C37|nr:hypothetical protein [Gemmobacter aquatilis]
MKKLSTLLAAGAVLVSASTAFAGGPVVIADEPAPAVAVAPASSGSLGGSALLIPAALAVATIAIIAADNGSGSH